MRLSYQIKTLAMYLLVLLVVINAQAQSKETNDLIPTKKVGVTRVGVLLPNVSLKNTSKKVDPAIAIRQTFMSLLNSKTIELIPLNARLKCARAQGSIGQRM